MRTLKRASVFLCKCSNYRVHILENGEQYPKQYRRYFNEPDTVTCNCKTAGKRRIICTHPAIWGDEKCPYVIGEICKDCGIKFRPAKMWTMACEECRPKEDK